MNSLRYLLVGIIFTAAITVVGYLQLLRKADPYKKRENL